jgi:hypothetical protein
MKWVFGIVSAATMTAYVAELVHTFKASASVPNVTSATLIVVAVVTTATLLAPVLINSVFAKAAISRLANDAHARQTSLGLAAILFTASFILQLLATFQQPPT